MQEEWWEKPTCWLCNYGKWVIFALFLGLVIWLGMRGWSSVFSPPPRSSPVPTLTLHDTPSFFTPSVTPTPLITPSPNVSFSETPTPLPEIFGYRNDDGKYQFNYPSSWQGIEIGRDAQFRTPQGAMVYVHVETGTDSLEQLIGQENIFPYSIRESANVTISDLPALCQALTAAEREQILAIVCYLVTHGNGYIISIAELDTISDESRKTVISEFMDMVANFQIIP